MIRPLPVLALVTCMLALLPATAFAAGGPPDIERHVFIHYRQAAPPAAAEARGGGSGKTDCPDPATCADSKWQGHKWSGPVTYVLDASGSGVASATVTSAIAASVASWTAPTAGALSVSGTVGATSCADAGAVRTDSNQVCFRDLTATYPNAIAVTFVWASRATKQIVEADMVFNNGAGFTWSYTDPGACAAYADCNGATGVSGTYDVRNIGTHEFGHFFAFLGDLYNGRDGELTMYGYGATGEVKKDSLGRGDCLGITKAYGGSCL